MTEGMWVRDFHLAVPVYWNVPPARTCRRAAALNSTEILLVFTRSSHPEIPAQLLS